MGIVVNTANALATGVGNAAVGVGHGVQCPLHMVKRTGGMDKLGGNAAIALNYGSETAPLVSECKDLAEGIASADFQAATFNAGLLALYLAPSGAPTAKNLSPGFSSTFNIVTLATANQTLRMKSPPVEVYTIEYKGNTLNHLRQFNVHLRNGEHAALLKDIPEFQADDYASTWLKTSMQNNPNPDRPAGKKRAVKDPKKLQEDVDLAK